MPALTTWQCQPGRGIGERLRLLDPGLSDLVRTPHGQKTSILRTQPRAGSPIGAGLARVSGCGQVSQA